MIRMESHCHTQYSSDSALSIPRIISRCMKHEINVIIICDHDEYGLTVKDEKKFADKRIKLLKGVEFTTSEGVHIIGVSDQISNFIKGKKAYSSRELVKQLLINDAMIILPHPVHLTGIIGNKKIKRTDVLFVLNNANFIEYENYKYGGGKEIEYLLKKYKNLTPLVGSDAHSANNVGAFFNEIDINEEIFSLSNIKDKNIKWIKRKEHSNIYWKIKMIKRTKVYQNLLNIFPPKYRKYIKNNLINR